MQQPTKKLRNLAKRYTKINRDYEDNMREFIRTVEPMDDKDFWDVLEYFAKEVRSRMGYVAYNPFKSAAHNTMIYIEGQAEALSATPVQAWEMSARFVAAYAKWTEVLSKKCWDMPGVEKSDDSYGDWIDALPLAGHKVIFGIMEDYIANYKQVDKALDTHSPNLKERIQEGENYVLSNLEDQVIKRFSYAVAQEDRPTEDW
jgi:hypothetical protein